MPSKPLAALTAVADMLWPAGVPCISRMPTRIPATRSARCTVPSRSACTEDFTAEGYPLVERSVRRFGELEAAVMHQLWSQSRPMSVREVRDALSSRREWAYTTLLTVMDNLHSKGWLGRVQEGRAYIYAPVADRETYVAELMGEALRDSDDPASALLHFVGAMTSDDVEALRRALRKLDEEARSND